MHNGYPAASSAKPGARRHASRFQELHHEKIKRIRGCLDGHPDSRENHESKHWRSRDEDEIGRGYVLTTAEARQRAELKIAREELSELDTFTFDGEWSESLGGYVVEIGYGRRTTWVVYDENGRVLERHLADPYDHDVDGDNDCDDPYDYDPYDGAGYGSIDEIDPALLEELLWRDETHQWDWSLGYFVPVSCDGCAPENPFSRRQLRRTRRFQALHNGRITKRKRNHVRLKGDPTYNRYDRLARQEPRQIRRERRDKLADIALAVELDQLEEAANVCGEDPMDSSVDDFRFQWEDEHLAEGVAVIDDSDCSRVTVVIKDGAIVGAHAEDPERTYPRRRRSRNRNRRRRHVDTW